MNCDRCSSLDGYAHTMSMFNAQTLCRTCADAERAHPDYGYASAVEQGEVMRGNLHYPGVGWPGVGKRVERVVNRHKPVSLPLGVPHD